MTLARGTAVVVALVLVGAACSDSNDGPGPAKGAAGVRLTPQRPVDAAALERAATIIGQRLAKVGRDDAAVTVSDGALAVRATPPVDPAMLEVLARRGDFGFRLVTAVMPQKLPGGTACADKAVATLGAAAKGVLRGVPPDRSCYQVGPELLGRSSIRSSHASADEVGGGWAIDVTFNGDAFVRKIAEPYVGAEVAMVLDGVVLSAPMINPGITGHLARISGAFDETTAKAIAATLSVDGVLPVAFVAPR